MPPFNPCMVGRCSLACKIHRGNDVADHSVLRLERLLAPDLVAKVFVDRVQDPSFLLDPTCNFVDVGDRPRVLGQQHRRTSR